ncbi:MAG: VanZ family protein [Armatimonadota bacterium]
MVLIYFLSAQPASESNRLSIGIAEKIYKIISFFVSNFGANGDLFNQFNNIVRKSAHGFNYLILAMIIVNTFYILEIKRLYAFGYTIAITVLYAIADEIHQLYVPGRGCMFSDVIIDSVGAILGLFLFVLICRWRKIYR